MREVKERSKHPYQKRGLRKIRELIYRKLIYRENTFIKKKNDTYFKICHQEYQNIYNTYFGTIYSHYSHLNPSI